jgi:putative hydrolase of the HAD superfamily
MQRSKTHVLFDFFGTLVRYSPSRIGQDHETSHRLLTDAGSSLSYREFLQRWDSVWEEFECAAAQTLIEYSMDDVCSAFLRQTLGREPDTALMIALRDQYLAEWSLGVAYLPEVPELLAQLSQHFVLALITNTHHAALVHTHLQRMDARRYFAAVVTSVEHGKRKPDRAIFAHTLELVGGTPSGSIYVGDSHAADYLGATSAGLDCLLIDPDQRHAIPPAHRIAHIAEALRLRDPSSPARA